MAELRYKLNFKVILVNLVCHFASHQLFIAGTGERKSENRAAAIRVSDLYTCNLLKMYYKLCRNMLPVYFESFTPEYGDYHHNLRNDQIRLPLIRCEYGEMNVKY